MARSIKKEAADEGTTVNADINSIISRHFNWHKKLREYGFVTVARSAFTNLVEGLDGETLARIGREVIPPLYEEMAELWFQDSAPEKILDAINTRFKFDPLMRAKITKEGNEYTVVFRHDLGPKWSILVESASREIVKRFFHTEPRISRGESVVTARFKVNPRNLPT
ncbi:MAG: hypothetical protein ABSB29_06270 [Nitrososphaerales archaeon]